MRQGFPLPFMLIENISASVFLLEETESGFPLFFLFSAIFFQAWTSFFRVEENDFFITAPAPSLFS